MSIEIQVLSDESEEPFVVALVRSSAGTLKVLAEVTFEDDCLILDGLHVHGLDRGANAIGPGRLRRIVREVADELGVEAVVIAGARRTSGAFPGHHPRAIRIARRASPEQSDP